MIKLALLVITSTAICCGMQVEPLLLNWNQGIRSVSDGESFWPIEQKHALQNYGFFGNNFDQDHNSLGESREFDKINSRPFTNIWQDVIDYGNLQKPDFELTGGQDLLNGHHYRNSFRGPMDHKNFDEPMYISLEDHRDFREHEIPWIFKLINVLDRTFEQTYPRVTLMHDRIPEDLNKHPLRYFDKFKVQHNPTIYDVIISADDKAPERFNGPRRIDIPKHFRHETSESTNFEEQRIMSFNQNGRHEGSKHIGEYERFQGFSKNDNFDRPDYWINLHHNRESRHPREYGLFDRLVRPVPRSPVYNFIDFVNSASIPNYDKYGVPTRK